MTKKIALFITLIALMAISLQAADLQETLESLSGSAAASYVNPMVSAFGANMNGGWFHKAPKAKLFGWDLEFGIVMMGTMFPDDDKTFSATADFNFNLEQAQSLANGSDINPAYYDEFVNALVSTPIHVTIGGPTIIGVPYDETQTDMTNPNAPTNPTALIVAFNGDPIQFTYGGYSQTVNMPAKNFVLPFGGVLEDVAAIPLAAPQLSIGTVAGTKLAFRYLPDTEISPEIGKLKYLGFGIQHNPAFWIPFKIPVDLGLSFFTQSLDVGDIIETNATTYGLNVSKTWGMKLLSVTPYAGVAGESSEMKFHYSYPTGAVAPAPTELDVAFDVKGKNTSRITLGTSFRLAIFNINFDYNIAKYPSATAGFMFNLGW